MQSNVPRLPVQQIADLENPSPRIRLAFNDASVGLAYGRHCGPVPHDARRAAVLVMLAWDGVQWNIPLTMRPLTLRHHGGQICFPGGRLEAGETPVTAAVREFKEELGSIPSDLHVLGQLSTIHVYASHNVVTPIVARTYQRLEMRPDPVEVEQAILLPWSQLVDESCWVDCCMKRPVVRNRKIVDTFTFRYRAIQFRQYLIWGATAMMLAELSRVGYQ